jgi:hypothetical protein
MLYRGVGVGVGTPPLLEVEMRVLEIPALEAMGKGRGKGRAKVGVKELEEREELGPLRETAEITDLEDPEGMAIFREEWGLYITGHRVLEGIQLMLSYLRVVVAGMEEEVAVAGPTVVWVLQQEEQGEVL